MATAHEMISTNHHPEKQAVPVVRPERLRVRLTWRPEDSVLLPDGEATT